MSSLSASGNPRQPSTMSSPMLLGYAMLRANFSAERGNFTDNFTPFVIDAVRSKHPVACSVDEATEYIRSLYGVQIPALVAKNLMRRAERAKRLIRDPSEKGSPRYLCTSKELENVSSVASDYATSTRQQHALSDALLAFAKENYPDLAGGLDRDACGSLIASYMDANALPLLRSSLRGGQGSLELEASEHFLVSEFIAKAYDSNQEHFSAFVEIAKGATLAAVIQMDVSSLDASLRQLAVFVDTPLVLDVLGYHGVESQSATLDMMELAKNLGARVQVFEHTVREVRSVLEAAKEALRSKAKRMENFRVALFFVEADKSAADVEIALQKIDESIRSHGIQIVPKPDDYGDFGLDESRLTENVQQEVHRQNLTATHYDVDSVHAVHRLRRLKAGARLDQARALFVTSNSGLVRAADRSREEPTEFPLVILDSALASLLWVRSPLLAKDLPAKQVIATAWAGMQPEPGRWAEYLADVEKLEETGEISHDDALLIRMSSESQYELMRESHGRPEKFAHVSPSKIISSIKARATEPLETEILELKESNVKEQELAHVTETILRKELKTLQANQAQTSKELTILVGEREKQRDSIRNSAKRVATVLTRICLILVILVVGIIASLATVGSEITQSWPSWLRNLMFWLGLTVTALIAIANLTSFDAFKVRLKLTDYLEEKIVQRRLKQAGM